MISGGYDNQISDGLYGVIAGGDGNEISGGSYGLVSGGVDQVLDHGMGLVEVPLAEVPAF